MATEIEEEFEGGIRAGSTVKKNPSVKNTGTSDAFVRVRITISPEQTEVTLLNGTWNGTAFFGERQGSGQHCDREYAV